MLTPSLRSEHPETRAGPQFNIVVASMTFPFDECVHIIFVQKGESCPILAGVGVWFR